MERFVTLPQIRFDFDRINQRLNGYEKSDLVLNVRDIQSITPGTQAGYDGPVSRVRTFSRGPDDLYPYTVPLPPSEVLRLIAWDAVLA